MSGRLHRPNATSAIEPLLCRFDTASRVLDTPTATMRTWVAAGLLRPLRIGRTVYFSMSELRRFVRALEAEQQSSAPTADNGQGAKENGDGDVRRSQC